MAGQDVSALEPNRDLRGHFYADKAPDWETCERYLPVLLCSLEETQALVHFRPHLVHVGHGVDGPGIVRSQSEALQQQQVRTSGGRVTTPGPSGGNRRRFNPECSRDFPRGSSVSQLIWTCQMFSSGASGSQDAAYRCCSAANDILELNGCTSPARILPPSPPSRPGRRGASPAGRRKASHSDT